MGLMVYIVPPDGRHLFKLVDDRETAGPFVCCCGLVCWDAEQSLHHLTIMDKAAALTPAEARTAPR